MKLSAAAALAALGAAVSGCATIVEGTTQPVSVATTPVAGAQCTLVNSQGTWYLTSPGSVTVQKTKTDLDVTCRRKGYRRGHVLAVSHFRADTAGNVVFGVVGAPIGAGVDAASGANFYYDSPIMVPLGAVLAEGETEGEFPVTMHCSDPSMAAEFVADGPMGYVTATVRFSVNASGDPNAVNVTPSKDGVCTIAANDNTMLRSASFEVGSFWSNDGQPMNQHIEVVATAPEASHGKNGPYIFTVKAKDKGESKLTLKFPVSYQ